MSTIEIELKKKVRRSAAICQAQALFRFEPAGESTWIVATAVAPVRGLKRLLRPLLAVALRKLGEQALEEDRADLEEGNYQPPATARAA